MDLICSNDPINDVESFLLMLFQMNSIGFKTREYAGRNIRSIFNDFA